MRALPCTLSRGNCSSRESTDGRDRLSARAASTQRMALDFAASSWGWTLASASSICCVACASGRRVAAASSRRSPASLSASRRSLILFAAPAAAMSFALILERDIVNYAYNSASSREQFHLLAVLKDNFAAMTRTSTSPASEPAADRRGLDRIDRKLLARLQQDGRAAVSQLAREVNLTVTPTLERVRRLESAGHIEGYFARLNPAMLGLGLLAYVEVSLDRTTPDAFERFKQVMLAHDEVMECHMVAGGFD